MAPAINIDGSRPAPVPVVRYVILLERHPERRTAVASRLAKAGVSAEYYDAIDHTAEVNKPRLAALPSESVSGSFGDADKACALTHLTVLSAFVQSGARYGLLLQDDAEVAEDLGAWLGDLGWWPQDAEIVRMERGGDATLKLVMGKGSRHLGRQIRPLFSRQEGAVGYIVNRAGAKRILAASRPETPLDQHLFDPALSQLARDLVTYQIEPALVKKLGAMPAVQDSGHRPRVVAMGWKRAKRVPKLLSRIVLDGATVGPISFASSVDQGPMQ